MWLLLCFFETQKNEEDIFFEWKCEFGFFGGLFNFFHHLNPLLKSFSMNTIDRQRRKLY